MTATAVEPSGVDLLDAGDLAAAGVRDQDVDRPEDGLDLVDEARAPRIGEVGAERRGPGQRRRQLLRRLGVGGVGSAKVAPAGGEALGDPAPDASAGAGDERCCAFEGRHGWVAHCMMSNARAPRGPAS